MKKLKSIRYPKLLNIKELDDCRNLGCDEVDDMSIAESSHSEDETLQALDQQLHSSKRTVKVQGSDGDSDEDSEELGSDKDTESSGSGSEYRHKSNESSSDEEDNSGVSEPEEQETSVLKSQNTRTQQRKCAPCWDSVAPVSNWKYGSWFMGKTLEELEKMPYVEELYLDCSKVILTSLLSAWRV